MSIVIAIKDIYLILREIMKRNKITSAPFSCLVIGVSWARTGGESSAINEGDAYVHGIDNVSDILEQAVQGGLDDIDFLRLLLAPGCLGVL